MAKKGRTPRRSSSPTPPPRQPSQGRMSDEEIKRLTSELNNLRNAFDNLGKKPEELGDDLDRISKLTVSQTLDRISGSLGNVQSRLTSSTSELAKHRIALNYTAKMYVSYGGTISATL